MSGSGPESAQSSGYRHRLYARALILEDRRGERIVLVVTDLPLVSALLHRMTAARLYELQTGLGADRLIIAATHTHAGPGNYHEAKRYNTEGGALPGYDPAMVDFLVTRILRAVTDADADLGPARAAWGSATVAGLTRNRSIEAFLQNDSPTLPLPDGLPSADDMPNANPDADTSARRKLEVAAVDQTWNMLRVDRCDATWENCRPKGAFSIFALHGTGYPAANRLLDGDLHAIVERRLEDHIDGLNGVHPLRFRSEAFHLFANGSVGDVSAVFDASTRCEGLLSLEVGYAPGGLRRPPPLEEWRYPRTSTSNCLDRARRAVNTIGDRLADRAIDLYDSLGRNGGSQLLDDFTIERAFTTVRLDSAVDNSLCPDPTAGFSNAAGSTEDARVRVEGWKILGLIRTGLEEGGRAVDTNSKGCDGAKKRLLGSLQRYVNGEYGFPRYAQFAVVRIGKMLVATVPGEPTTVTGHRMKLAIGSAANHPSDHVAILSHANGYIQYIATAEEYAMQHYEGGSTLYGPNSSTFVADQLARLAESLNQGDPVVSVAPIHGNTGAIQSYMARRASATGASSIERKVLPPTCEQNVLKGAWLDADPASVMASDEPLIEIQRLTDSGKKWQTVAWDDYRSVEVRVKRTGDRGATDWEFLWTPHSGAANDYAPSLPSGKYRLYLPARPVNGGTLPEASSLPVDCL